MTQDDKIPVDICPLFVGADLPACVVRPLLQIAWLSSPTMPEFFVRKVLASLSLNIAEKNRVLTTDLSELQMVELDVVFDEERDSFTGLFQDETQNVMHLQAKAIMDAFLLASYCGHTVPPALERALIARMVKRVVRRVAKLGLSHKLTYWMGNTTHITATVWHHLYPADHPAALQFQQADPGGFAATI